MLAVESTCLASVMSGGCFRVSGATKGRKQGYANVGPRDEVRAG